MRKEEWIVPPSAEGVHLDAFVRQRLPDWTESALRKLFTRRDVRLDGARVRDGSNSLRAGQTVAVYLPEDASSQALRIVYEDDRVLLVNKRGGMSVEPDASGSPSLTELCQTYVHSSHPDEPFLPLPCHRLDARTCGLCLFAKDAEALAILLDVFRLRTLNKRYECLVRGEMKPPAATCGAWLLKDAAAGRVTILDHSAPFAKSIMTAYETLEAGTISRLSVHLITGRTHQIRAHLAALGHPILGDDLYGDRALNRERKARSLKLCAVSLTLNTDGRLPQLDGREFRISAPF